MKIPYIDQVKLDRLYNIKLYRKNLGAKLINNLRGQLIISKDSIVKIDIVHLSEWFKYLNVKTI